MIQGRSPAVEARPRLGELVGALNSFANHTMLVLGCYFVATFASQLTIYIHDGRWIGGVRPLYVRITNGDAFASSPSAALLTYVLDDIDVLLLLGCAILLFGSLKLASGTRSASWKAGMFQPKTA